MVAMEPGSCFMLSSAQSERVRVLAKTLKVSDEEVIALALEKLEASTSLQQAEGRPRQSEPMEWCFDDYSYIKKT